MFIKNNIIVLSKIKYSESDLIIKAYSREQGIISYILKGILKQKKGKLRASHFQLLSQLAVESNHKPNRQLQSIKDARLNYFYKSIHTNVFKASIIIFLSEMLSSVIKEEEPNEALYDFLVTSFQWFDHQDEFANFHLLFLVKLTKYLGCYPDVSNIEAPFFSMSKGVFTDEEQDVYSISDNNLTILKQLLGTNFEAINSIQLSAQQRQSFLNMFLLYFELHLGDFKKPKSLEVFKQVFS
ncbi:DNA repair protein RecO [Winogradskyella sp. 3972H.M.0a.05]|uniref:DNA repair protein RecO n=1 Tax=Winogradskyella sp. 3972H.M.0a.05 TaxID=2950277 RepID=UPI0033964B79